jgi:hypothetical protein
MVLLPSAAVGVRAARDRRLAAHAGVEPLRPVAGVVLAVGRVPPEGGERELGGLVQQVLGHDESPSVRGQHRG